MGPLVGCHSLVVFFFSPARILYDTFINWMYRAHLHLCHENDFEWIDYSGDNGDNVMI